MRFLGGFKRAACTSERGNVSLLRKMSHGTTPRALNAKAEAEVAAALKAGSDQHRGSDKSELLQAIELCKEALNFGHTPRVLHSISQAQLELGKIHHLEGDDRAALNCLEATKEWLAEVEEPY